MNRRRASLLAATILIGIAATVASAHDFSAWGTATKIDEIPGWSSELNTAYLDGCPIQAPDGLSRFGTCSGPPCTGVFVDATKNRSKRYCCHWCANREAQRRHRARPT